MNRLRIKYLGIIFVYLASVASPLAGSNLYDNIPMTIDDLPHFEDKRFFVRIEADEAGHANMAVYEKNEDGPATIRTSINLDDEDKLINKNSPSASISVILPMDIDAHNKMVRILSDFSKYNGFSYEKFVSEILKDIVVAALVDIPIPALLPYELVKVSKTIYDQMVQGKTTKEIAAEWKRRDEARAVEAARRRHEKEAADAAAAASAAAQRKREQEASDAAAAASAAAQRKREQDEAEAAQRRRESERMSMGQSAPDRVRTAPEALPCRARGGRNGMEVTC